MKNTAASLALVGAMLALSGCASIVNGKRQALPLTSDPPDATASWDGQVITTPGMLVVHRKSKNVAIRFEKPGYQPCVLKLTREPAGAFWANLALIGAGLYAGGAVGYNSSSSRGQWLFGGWGDAIVGGVIGGVTFPLAAMAVDASTGRGFEQTPTKLKVVLAPAEPGKEAASLAEVPACVVGDAPRKEDLAALRRSRARSKLPGQ